ncbi:MAG: cytochrome c, partial [Armatimonadetes bacterium]|nr:cytochrome c [Armatimonadota bacterium]
REWRILPPPGTPSERQDTAGVPGGKRIFARYCGSCHSRDGEGHGDASASPPVPDLVAFGARITEPFVYDDGQLPTDLGERKARLARISPQHTALQEGAGPYAGHGKAARTPLQWFNAVSGDENLMRNYRGEKIAAHIQAPFNRPDSGVTRQMRWDAVYYLWSLSEDVQTITDGGSRFQTNCNVCHGRVGHGDGPLAHGLEPRPRAFNNPVWLSDKTNQRLFDSITYGRVYTAMPPWEHYVSPDERWRIVEYLRTLDSYKYPTDYVVKTE